MVADLSIDRWVSGQVCATARVETSGSTSEFSGHWRYDGFGPFVFVKRYEAAFSTGHPHG